jgi:transposase
MAKPIVHDELWAVIEPLLPPEPDKPKGGRPRVSNRDVLRGIVFVLRTGRVLAAQGDGLRLGSDLLAPAS